MSENLVEVRDLVKHFPITQGIVFQKKVGAVRAVDGISFDVRKGETLGIVGETGCGKSTTAKLLLRLLTPTSGSIKFEDEEIGYVGGGKLKQLRREMQMIFQDPYSSLNPRKTVGAIIGDPFVIHAIDRNDKSRRKKVQELMEQVGLNPEHYNRFPHEFSGGQRQRIGVARALALRPKLIVADEPVSALDVSIQAQILNLLSELQRELGLTIVFIAHDLSVVRHMCDRVGVMYLGTMVETADNETLYSHPRHPYTGALLSAVPVADPHEARSKSRQILSGDVPSPTNPPPACRFHTRCPKAQERCWTDTPVLEPKEGGGMAACHYPLTDAEAAERIPGVAEAYSSSAASLLAVVLVERLGRDLLAAAVPQLHHEGVVAVVVGREQGEPVLDEDALVDGQVGQLGGDDGAARAAHRRAPDQGHGRLAPLLAAPDAHDLVAEVELPVRVAGRGLVGEVGDGLEVAGVALLVAGDERHVAEELVAAGGVHRGGHVGAPVPGAVGVELDLAGVAQLDALGVDAQARGEELLAQAIGPAAVGQELLRGFGGEAGDEAIFGRHGAALCPIGRRAAVSPAHRSPIRQPSGPRNGRSARPVGRQSARTAARPGPAARRPRTRAGCPCGRRRRG